jgi:SAM-dependent methyltransferase
MVCAPSVHGARLATEGGSGVTRPRLLDLFCGAGGAARGYQLAGFHVTGIDINPQPRYAGDEFHQADAMTFPQPEAPIRHDLLLCGSQFGLRVRRHRAFETSPRLYALVPTCRHRGLLPFMHKGERAYADALGCDWMTNREAREAIPPAFTRFVGEQLLAAIAVGAS